MAVGAGHLPSLLEEHLPELRAALESLRGGLQREITSGKRELARPAVAEDEGSGHGVAADLHDRELRLTEITRFKRELCEIQAALGRMRADVYGLCVDCGRPIPLDRLVARPQAARDVDCARYTEREAAL
ncbi:MAG: TraR/DksA family transcriptional regulator [Chloroflexota bacterium]|nr:TraR/DksA family transcriptional regulator [Chloroflexota bacterium]